jgi:hypothetical protein
VVNWASPHAARKLTSAGMSVASMTPAVSRPATKRSRDRRLPWPLRRWPRRILGVMTEPQAVRRLLGALGLAAEPPPGGPPPPPDPRSIAPTTGAAVPVCSPARGERSRPFRADLPPPLPDPPSARYRSGAPLAAWPTPRAGERGAEEGTRKRG